MCCFFPFFRYLKALDHAFEIQDRLGVLAATCAARKRLPLRTSAIRRSPVRSASPVSPQHRKDLLKNPQGLIHFILCIQLRETESDG